MQTDKVARYLAVPLQLGPLIFIAVFSALFMLALKASILGIPLALLLFLGFCKYSFALLDSVVSGALEPPVLSVEMMNPVSGMRSLLLLAIAASAFFGTGAASFWMVPAVRVAVGLVVATLLISIIMVQAATGSLIQAVNPWRCARLIARLGLDYVLILVCVLGCIILGYLLSLLDFLPFAARIALLMFAWLAVFALMGGVLRERRFDIGLDDADQVEPVELDHSTADARQRDLLVDEIYAEWRGGAHRNAWQTITRHLEAGGDPVAELGWLYERAARWPDRRLANRLAEELIVRLLALRHHGQVLNLIGERLRVDPDFRPRASTDLIRWIELARDGADRRIARALLKDFPRLYPDDNGRADIEALQRQLER